MTARANKRTQVGELRPSQLLHTFGVGAIVDLPHISAMVMGLEDWHIEGVQPIQEDRLLKEVQRRLGSQVQALLPPPAADDAQDRFSRPFDDTNLVGVPLAPFPRWMRCPKCYYLAPLSSGLFSLRIRQGRPDETRYVHHNCNQAQQPSVLPARFLLTCPAGHLDDFPWRWYVHRGESGCFGALELRELGVSGEATDVQVHCRDCKRTRSMADAFAKDQRGALPPCRGRRPQLRDFEEQPCSQKASAILLGASNIWFAVQVAALYVPPPPGSELARLVEELWSLLTDVEDLGTLKFLRKQGKLGTLASYPDGDLMAAIQARRAPAKEADDDGDLKKPEWAVFSKPDPKRNSPDFELEALEPPSRWKPWIKQVVRATRLREVSALTAFTRIASPRDYADGNEVPSDIRARISRNPPVFVPAAEVRGEGIFLQFDEERLASYCDENTPRESVFESAHRAWRRRRGLNPATGFPKLRFVVMHTFAHALMRELALECGYTMASLRERIYSGDEPGKTMAGVLIYTAAPDAEGTLGGLVRLGLPDELDRHIGRALSRLGLCSSDPLCAEHDPSAEDGTLHGGACHACLFAPETSCEKGNRYLDRNVLVQTVRGGARGFFNDPRVP